MTINDPSPPGTDNLHDLLALYALDALDADDRALVERRLATDAQARLALDELRATVGELHDAFEPLEPPDRPKERVLARIDASLASEHISQRARVPAPETALARLLRALWPALALAAIVLAFGLGAWGLSLRQQLLATQAQLADVEQQAALLQAPDLRVASLPPSKTAPPTARITFMSAASSSQGLLMVSGLPPVAANWTYQLWLLKGGQPVSAGLFNVDASGAARLHIVATEPMADFQQAGITIEPAGGSPAPTLTALVSIGPID